MVEGVLKTAQVAQGMEEVPEDAFLLLIVCAACSVSRKELRHASADALINRRAGIRDLCSGYSRAETWD